MSLKARIERLELNPVLGTALTLCHVEGGGCLSATFAGRSYLPEAGEPPAAFELRMIRAAGDAGAAFLAVGQLIEDDMLHLELPDNFDPAKVPAEDDGWRSEELD